MLHGDQRGAFDLDFRIPSECAQAVANGAADIGIIPSVELNRHDYARVRGLGIASHGAVRSILLVSSQPFSEIRTLAADISSRTSVALARVILARRYGAAPRILPLAPDLHGMLSAADAALIIGDPALRVDIDALHDHVLDLGAAWNEMTGLPMVFAVWAGRKEVVTPEAEAVFHESFAFGRAHLDDIIRVEAGQRRIDPQLAREYLTRHIVCGLGPADYRGLELFLEYARVAQEAAAV